MPSNRSTIAVWDLPTRLGHWSLVALVGFSWWSAEAGRMDWHRWSGYAVLFLIVFRLYWGFAGPRTARFASFVRGPGATFAYLRTLARRAPSPGVGHNPLGALSILALLATLIVQVVCGLFSVDIDGLESGPLADRVDFDTGRAFAHWHHLSFQALQALVILHVAAIGFYLVFKRANLVGPMITGRGPGEPGQSLTEAPLWRLALGLVLALALAWAVAKGLRLP